MKLRSVHVDTFSSPVQRQAPWHRLRSPGTCSSKAAATRERALRLDGSRCDQYMRAVHPGKELAPLIHLRSDVARREQTTVHTRKAALWCNDPASRPLQVALEPASNAPHKCIIMTTVSNILEPLRRTRTELIHEVVRWITVYSFMI